MVWLEFELAYRDVTVQYFRQYTMEALTSKII